MSDAAGAAGSAAPFTYSEVGATLEAARRGTPLPRDAHPFRHRRRVGQATDLDRAAEFVLGLGMQRGAGLGVPAGARAEAGARFTLWLGRRPAALAVPVGVVGVLDEGDLRGFAYGTLPGHPESGEELFAVERVGEDLWAEVRGFSRPGRWYVALAGPVARWVQARMALRYLRAVRRHLAAG